MELQSGVFSRGFWFSSLLLEACRENFTGAFVFRAPTEGMLVFFSNGQPHHASGRGFKEARLGQLLVASSVCTVDDIDHALAEQKLSIENGSPQLIGKLLPIGETEVNDAIRTQIRLRLGLLAKLQEGSWDVAHGDTDKIRQVSVPLDAWSTFFELLQNDASNEELRHQADHCLGYLIRLREDGVPRRVWRPHEKTLLDLLRRPRKLDHLERALRKRRMVRGFVRALSLIGALERIPPQDGGVCIA